jgi:hypothetical protein
MKIDKIYSHLNGQEFLIVHKKALYDEIISTIEEIDADKFRTKVSKERGRVGNFLYNPGELNAEFKRVFELKGWESVRRDFYVSDDYEIVRHIESLSTIEQKEYLESINYPLIFSYNQTDFVKDKIAIEVQLGKYFAVTYDLFVKHLSFYNSGMIDIGVEIVPSKELQKNMSSGPPFYEKEVHNVLRHGRNSPAVPIIMIGVSP